MKHILIATQSHLCRNPRVLKEALTLVNAGYKVSILTAIYSDELLQEDISLIKGTNISYEFYSDLRAFNFISYKSRLIRKLFTLLQAKVGIETILSLGYSLANFKQKCLSANADLYIMHQETATIIGSKMAGKFNVAFDMEDWYSEDLLPDARKGRPIQLLKKAEKAALQKGTYCTTTSIAIANALKAEYNVADAPYAIYNSFNYADPETSKKNRSHSNKIVLVFTNYWAGAWIGIFYKLYGQK